MGKRHKPEEIIAKLRQVEVMTGQGTSMVDAIRSIGVTEVTYYRWRSEYGGMKLDLLITVPWDFYAPDPNRLVWAPDADELWGKMINDKPLSKRLSSEAVSAAQRPGAGSTESPKSSPTTTPSEEPTRSAEEIAEENGLCA